jgi:hypothetical protein
MQRTVEAANVLREKEPLVFLLALLFVTFIPPQTSPLRSIHPSKEHSSRQ